jgi:magnesium transporter
MKAVYALIKGEVRRVEPDEIEVGQNAAPIRVYANPTQEERDELIDQLGLDAYDIDAALDPDEIPRLESSAGTTCIIWKRPKNVSFDQQLRFDVASMGIFLRKDMLILVTAEAEISFADREFRALGGLSDFLLKLLLHTVHHYLGHLKVIKQITTELGSKISVAMENRYYLQMIALSESLIFYIDGIEANAAVINKLKASAERLCLTVEQVDALHDISLDMQQCARQATIYSEVLSGLMDARGNIINNNISVLLKNLTLISVIFLPLNLIASIGGMSEFSVWTQSVSPVVSYTGFGLGMALLGWLMWVLLRRGIDRYANGRHR